MFPHSDIFAESSFPTRQKIPENPHDFFSAADKRD